MAHESVIGMLSFRGRGIWTGKARRLTDDRLEVLVVVLGESGILRRESSVSGGLGVVTVRRHRSFLDIGEARLGSLGRVRAFSARE